MNKPHAPVPVTSGGFQLNARFPWHRFGGSNPLAQKETGYHRPSGCCRATVETDQLVRLGPTDPRQPQTSQSALQPPAEGGCSNQRRAGFGERLNSSDVDSVSRAVTSGHMTGWKMRPDAGTVGSGTRTPTHESPTPAQGNMGADLATPGTQRDTSKSGSPRSTGSDSKDDE